MATLLKSRFGHPLLFALLWYYSIENLGRFSIYRMVGGKCIKPKEEKRKKKKA